MSRTVTPTRQIDFFEAEQMTDSIQADPKVPRRGNSLMKRLNPSFLLEPRELDFADGMRSDEFCYEKGYRLLLEPLEFKNKKEWLDYCGKVWQWAEDAEQRALEAEAKDYLEKLKANPKLLNLVKANLSEPQG